MEKTIVSKHQIISELSRSPHGALKEYVNIGSLAAQHEPDFFAHLIAWDAINGQIRDAKAALPIITMSCSEFPDNLIDNSLAHLAKLNPRELLKAYRFALEIKVPGRHRQLKRMIESYLRAREANGWDRVAVQHRDVLRSLYSLLHLKPGEKAGCVKDSILFGPSKKFPVKAKIPAKSIFAAIRNLKDMSPIEAAGTILEKKIPFLVAVGALGKRAKEKELVLALLERMTPTEVVTNTKMLERLGVKDVPELKAAFEKALEKAAKSKKTTFKATEAAKAVGDESLKKKLVATQEKQIKNLKGVDGNWLVLGDKSGSMDQSIEVARRIAATLAKMVSGKVVLSFFDTSPITMDVTGKTYDEILKETGRVQAIGGTSIGCGLAAAINRKEDIDGIAIVSDAQENTPPHFVNEYKRFVKIYDKEVPVYLYRCDTVYSGWSDNELANSMKDNGFDLQEFAIPANVDYYSLPNMVSSMRTNQYSLAEEIMDTPLLTLQEVLNGYARK